MGNFEYQSIRAFYIMGIFSRKIASNSLWMMLEKFIGIFGLIFVMSYVAKYIGPSNFGKIALVTTIFTFVQSFVWFGNQEILFKRVSKNSISGLKYLHATQKLRTAIFGIISLPVLITLYIFSDVLTLIFGIATALSTYFLTQDIYNIYNNATLNSYINAVSNTFGLIIALLVRYLFVSHNYSYEYLAIPIVIVTLVPYILKNFIFNKQHKISLKSTRSYKKYYFFAGSALLLSSLSISFYTQITSFLLGTLKSTTDLGIYAAALPIGVSWSFVNLAIITSVLSKIYSEKNSFKSYEMVFHLNVFIIFISLVVVCGLYFLGSYVIEWLYGAAYKEAYDLLLVLCFATMFSGLGTVAARFLIKEEAYTYISRKMLCVAILSLPIAWFCIYLGGAKGAAYSIMLIELLSATVFNYFYKNGLIFKIHFFPLFKQHLNLTNKIQSTSNV